MEWKRRGAPGRGLLVRFCLAISVAILFVGCSAMSPRECLETDWQARGVRDAEAGLPVTVFLHYHRDCNLQGVNPDRWAFVLGWEQGAG